MSPFRDVRDALNLTHTAGTSMGWHHVYLLLTMLADQDETLGPASTTYSDPFKEVLHRLEPYRGFAVQELRRLLNRD